MNVIDKIKFLQKAEDDPVYYKKYFVDISVEKNRWQPGEIDDLRQQYPWLSQFYLEFIAEFDALGLAWIVFYGSRNCDVIPIWEEIDYWKDYLSHEEIPIGKYADGSIFTINSQNEICYYIKDDYECENPRILTNSFEDFINNWLLGPKYHEFAYTDNNSFYDFLKDQGWV